jgi:hypothetical protein
MNYRTIGPAVIAATAMALTLSIAGCGTSENPTSPSQTSSAESTASTPTRSPGPAGAPSPEDRLGLETLDAIVQGDFPGAAARFDTTMQQQLPPEGLEAAWTTYQQQFGSYQSHGDPEDVAVGDLTVVNVPLQMEREPGQFRVTFHGDGSIAGLYFLKEGVPVS